MEATRQNAALLEASERKRDNRVKKADNRQRNIDIASQQPSRSVNCTSHRRHRRHRRFNICGPGRFSYRAEQKVVPAPEVVTLPPREPLLQALRAQLRQLGLERCVRRVGRTIGGAVSTVFSPVTWFFSLFVPSMSAPVMSADPTPQPSPTTRG